MSNFWQRIITGTVFIAVIVGAIYFQFVFELFLIVQAIGVWEFIGHGIPHIGAAKKVFYTVWSSLLYVLFIQLLQRLNAEEIVHSFPVNYILAPTILLLFIPLVIELFSTQKTPLECISKLWFAVGYVSLPFALATTISTQYAVENSSAMPLLLVVLLFIWSNDTFAYLTGRAFGKTPLFTRISPKKTIEGTVGGILITTGVAWFIYSPEYPISQVNFLIFAALVCVTGILGDLVESMFKRQWNIKDSGTILPGHGGILDRFDSFILVMPFAYVFLSIY